MVKKIISLINGYWFVTALVLFCVLNGSVAAAQITIVTDAAPGAPVAHGLDKLLAALQSKSITVENVKSVRDATNSGVIVAGLSEGPGAAAQLLKASKRFVPKTAEALSVWKTTANGKQVWVINGYDDRGLMYALLDVSNRVGWSKSNLPMAEVKEITEKPAVTSRAISIYTMNRAYWESRLYNEDYWAKYLDMLSENRFNSLVVIFGYENGGFLAPCYPYFFDTEGYPDVKMVGLTAEQQQKNLASFNRLIDMAHARGISFTAGIWDHIYRGGVQGGGLANTKNAPDQPVPGLVWGVNENNLVSYNKAALEKFIKLVPNLDAIQFRLHDESGLKKEEQLGFWLDVFKMIKRDYPKMRLDLRAKELPEAVIQGALDIGINFRITTKYWMEQMGLPYHPTQINPEKSPRRHSYSDLLRYPQQYKMHWRLWNGGTSRILLWGSPDYVKRFAETSHLYDGDGYEVNEPLATKMEAQPHDAPPFDLLNPAYRYYTYEFERYWHFFQSFGRVGYNPNTSPDTWQKEFEKKFGAAAPFVQKGLQEASWILPRIITSSYPYSQFPTTRGWAEKQYMGDLAKYAKADITDIRQFTNFDEEAQLIIEKGETPKILQSANRQWFLKTHAVLSQQINQAEKLAGNNKGKEFNSTIVDLKILNGLALYYAQRIPAAVYYRLYDRSKDVAAFDSAIVYESKAVEAWRQVVDAAGDMYTSDLMMGLREADLCGHWKDGLAALEKDMANLRSERANVKPAEKASNIHYVIAPAKPGNVFAVAHQPVTTATPGKPITISVKLTARAGVKWARLKYRSVNQEEEYKTLPMVAGTTKDVYTVTIPASAVNPKFDFMYFIEMMDNNQSGHIYPDLNVQTPYFIVTLLRN